MSKDEVDRIVEQWEVERPDLDASPILVVGRIERLHAKVEAALRPTFAAEQLGNGDFDVLAALRRNGSPFAMRPADLSRALLVTTGAITKRIDRLENAGHVDRTESVEDDGRGKLVRLTEHGRTFIDQMILIHFTNEHRLLEALTATERHTLATLLAKLDASL